MLPQGKSTQVRFDFVNDSQTFSGAGNYGLSYAGKYESSGFCGTYAGASYQSMTIRRVIMTSNGSEYAGGTLEASIGLGLAGEAFVEVFNSGPVPRTEWRFQANYSGGVTQDSCSWVSETLDSYKAGSLERPLSLNAKASTVGLSGNPEGFGITVVADLWEH